ncbi:MAG: eukaryotic-like serine/threonine-protein kinase [Solirubrobacteraceae bacterium]|nr:eukaryotic-like serine/threonine-protein kinase [Solirubrobacteraceae bacterium]
MIAGVADTAARRYCDPEAAPAGLETPSLACGAAGVAYFLLRHSRCGGGDASLEAAQTWVAQAERVRGRPGEPSLHFGEAGIWWVGALVAAEAGDVAGARRAAGRFVRAAARAFDAPGDVTSGSAGLLLGCAQLVTTFDDSDAITVGTRLARDLANLADREVGLPDEIALGFLGAAHGWGGVAHALLRWSSAIGAPPTREALALLERLAAHDDTPAHRLLSGELGVVLLHAELEDPDHAAMPVFQAVG